MPELNSIKEKYKGQEVVFLGLGLDAVDPIKDFLTKHTFNYTLLTDAGKTAEAYNVSAYPTSMVIDRTGKIRYVQVSGRDIRESLSREIDSVL